MSETAARVGRSGTMRRVTQTRTVARPALVVTGAVLLGLTCGVGGWFIGAEGEPTSVDHAPFEARVETVNDDGRRGCLAPVNPTVLENLGGSVCGQIFVAAGTDTSQGARVLVRWFTTNAPVGGSEDENVETFILEPSGLMR